MATGNDPKEKGLLLQTPLSRYPPKPNTIPITSVLATRATRKTTRFSVRDAKYNAAGAMHRVAWALQDSKAIGQICEKPLENLWFTSEEDRNRTTHKFPGKLALRHHARREIRRAPISWFETTRNTIHQDQLALTTIPIMQFSLCSDAFRFHVANICFDNALMSDLFTKGINKSIGIAAASADYFLKLLIIPAQ